MADEITLALPPEEEFANVARLVLGGIAARLELTYDRLEDLQVALDALLERRRASDGVEVSVSVDDGTLRTTIGPFDAASLDDLERDDDSLSLRRILETVVDTFELEEREGRRWIQLTKRTDD
jgi:hypothetical protein